MGCLGAPFCPAAILRRPAQGRGASRGPGVPPRGRAPRGSDERGRRAAAPCPLRRWRAAAALVGGSGNGGRRPRGGRAAEQLGAGLRGGEPAGAGMEQSPARTRWKWPVAASGRLERRSPGREGGEARCCALLGRGVRAVRSSAAGRDRGAWASSLLLLRAAVAASRGTQRASSRAAAATTVRYSGPRSDE